MATSDQLRALLQSYVADDREQFLSIALQLAAGEARKGHTTVARDLKALVDAARTNVSRRPVPIGRPKGDLADLLTIAYPHERLGDLVLSDQLMAQIRRVLLEQRQVAAIRSHGLHARRKLLLAGPPGTGKTLCARAIAGELGLPLFVVRMDAIVTKFMGETSAKLRHVFDAVADRRGVYLFDEFDSIGVERGRENDVGEMRRVLNTFLQLLDNDHSDSLVIAATNHLASLDSALFRRFDDVLLFELPSTNAIAELVRQRLSSFAPPDLCAEHLAIEALGLSHAEVSRACQDAVKDAIVFGRTMVDVSDVRAALRHQSRLLPKQRTPSP